MRNLATLVMMFLICVSLMAQVATAPVTGDGTVQNPYEIASLENLYWIAASDDIVPNPDQEARWSSHYVQIANIDASDTENWFDGQGWTPIGGYMNYQFSSFSGSYNGNEFTISNLYIYRPLDAYQGLFGLSFEASIQNMRLVDIDITGNYYIGGLIGANRGTISNCSSSGTINGVSNTGGIAGSNQGTITNCSSSGNTIVESHSGGLVGTNDGTISYSFNTGLVVGTGQQIGGVVGFNHGTITYCHNTGSINSSDYVSLTGGLVGSNDGEISDSYNTGSVTNTEGGAGGLVGRQNMSEDYIDYPSILNCYNSGDIVGIGLYNGGLVGSIAGSLYGIYAIRNSYYNYESVSINGEHIITRGALTNELYNLWTNSNYHLNIDDFLSLEDEYYLISSVEDFQKLLLFAEYPDLNFKVTTDINLIDLPNFCIPFLNANFNGDGHNISNLFFDHPSCIAGLFQLIENAYVQNIGVINVEITCAHGGGLAGTVTHNSVIDNCYVIGNVSGLSDLGMIGGLVGANTRSSMISNSYSTVSVNGVSAGGLAGVNYWNSNIINCYSNGSVIGTSDDVGGLIGKNIDSMTNSSYWNIETSGQTESDGGEGRTTDEMTYPYAANTYVDWDFAEIWAADVDFTINQGYPFLQELLVSVDKEVIAVIESSKLSNFPNPFNPETTISFALPQDTAKLDLQIYNIRGQLVRTLIAGTPFTKGEHQIVWDGRNDSGKTSASGIYFYRLTTPNFTQQKKMMLLK
jgi:hypothetical protein